MVRLLNPALMWALLCLVFLTFVQEAVLPHLSVSGVVPILVLLLVVDWTLLRGILEGMLCGLVGGILVDTFSGLPFGTSSLAFVLIAGMTSFAQSWLLRAHMLLPVVVGVLATLAYYSVAVVLVASMDHQFLLGGFTFRMAAGVAIYNGLLNVLLFAGAQALDRRVEGLRRATW